MENLTDDVIFYGILTKLPTKSLSRFSCVNKLWCAWITSPQFAKLQLLNQNSSTLTEDDLIALVTLRDQRLFSLPNNGLNNPVEMDYPFKSPCTYAYILGSCNGLLLVQIYDINDAGDPPKYLRLYIWNPCRKDDYLTLPPRIYTSLGEYHSYEVAVGFGHDSTTDDYKVIIINSKSTTKEGRRQDEEKLLNFWEDGKRFMIYFDIKSEKWREIPFAMNLEEGDDDEYELELEPELGMTRRGKLYVHYTKYRHCSDVFDVDYCTYVHVLMNKEKEFYGYWSEVCCLSSEGDPKVRAVLKVMVEDNIVLVSLDDNGGGGDKLAFYNFVECRRLITNAVVEVLNTRPYRDLRWHDAVHCRRSLVSPRQLT
ncbi:hypothetical protein Scep_011353 [Stephania cephalantha]|uniref:F-box domain-containing protein n=1 Tax=Stephania cephalantha TaxID=152367 RepID=A0AAP0JDZ7_9MAGN